MKYISLLFSFMFIFIIFSAAWPIILFLLVVFAIVSVYFSYKQRAFRDAYRNETQDENQDGFNPFQQDAPEGNQFEEKVENFQVIDAEYTESRVDKND